MKGEIKTFGFRKPKQRYGCVFSFVKRINFFFIGILILSFSGFSILSKFSTIVLADDKLQEFQKNLRQISVVFWSQDKELSNVLLSLDSVIKDYNSGGNIFKHNEGDLSLISNYIQNHEFPLDKFGLSEYKDFLDFLKSALKYKQDIFNLLGANQNKTYIILLENTGEKRPNGGFFGSYGLLNVNALRFDLKIYDSYYPDYINPNAKIAIPDWAENFLEDEKIGFVASNKFGFTDVDGINIKSIYEKIFPDQKIDGVIFLRSDFFEELLPGITDKLYRWQFINTSIDLIRGQDQPFKKEIYLEEINDYIAKNKSLLVRNFLQNIDSLMQKDYLKMYLEQISDGFNSFLYDNNFITKYSSDKIFAWDYNRSYSKIDRFVDKFIQIQDLSGNMIQDTDKDIIDISGLPVGTYDITIFYSINVPYSYEDFMIKLEQEFNISLSYREEHILGLNHVWNNKGVIYFPKNFEILSINGDEYLSKKFETPFSNNISYKIKNSKNNSLKFIKIRVIKE